MDCSRCLWANAETCRACRAEEAVRQEYSCVEAKIYRLDPVERSRMRKVIKRILGRR